jgi:hypothetical protein
MGNLHASVAVKVEEGAPFAQFELIHAINCHHRLLSKKCSSLPIPIDHYLLSKQDFMHAFCDFSVIKDGTFLALPLEVYSKVVRELNQPVNVVATIPCRMHAFMCAT